MIGDIILKKTTTKIFIIIGCFLLAIVIAFGVFFIINNSNKGNTDNNNSSPLTNSNSELSSTSSSENVMPNVVGQNYTTAKEQLEALGLRVVIKKEFHNDFDVNKVVSQSIKAGEGFESGDKVEIIISKGNLDSTLPKLTGKSLTEVTKTLSDLGLKISVTYKFENKTKPDIVIAQGTAAGTKLSAGSTVEVTVEGGVANTIGNTSENINNGGLVATQGEWIYFSNRKDNNYLYKIKKDGSELTLLTKTPAQNINVVGGWIYFSNQDIFKIKLDGSSLTKLLNENCVWCQVYNNWIYYINKSSSPKLNRMKIDGTTYQTVTSNTSLYVNLNGKSIICYTFEQSKDSEGEVYIINTNGFAMNSIYDARPSDIASNSKAIFMVDKKELNQITKYDLTTKESKKHTLANDINVTSINATEDAIYFVDKKPNASGKAAIYKLDPTTFKTTKLHEIKNAGSSNIQINVHDNWIYFINPDNGNKLYRIKTDGSKLGVFPS